MDIGCNDNRLVRRTALLHASHQAPLRAVPLGQRHNVLIIIIRLIHCLGCDRRRSRLLGQGKHRNGRRSRANTGSRSYRRIVRIQLVAGSCRTFQVSQFLFQVFHIF